MKIAWLHNWAEVDHVADIVITGLLEDYDAVVVNGYLGVEQYRQFGERVIIDCRDTGMQAGKLLDGTPIWKWMADMAEEAGLATLVCGDSVHGDGAMRLGRA